MHLFNIGKLAPSKYNVHIYSASLREGCCRTSHFNCLDVDAVAEATDGS